MWGTVLVFALLAAVDPVRIGIAVLLISRSRPMLNLLVFWLGNMATGIGAGLIALFLLGNHIVPITRAVTSAFTSPVVPSIQIVLGLLLLPTAAVVAVRSVRQAARVAVPCGDPSGLMSQPKAPAVFSRLSWTALLQGRSVRPAFVAGLCSATPPLEYWAAVLAILASGAAAGARVAAAVMFALVAYVITLIPLISHLASPAKTQAVVLELQRWIGAHRGQVFAVILGVGGVLMITSGVGGV
ncbi:GAP family protein [Mycobacterium sp.]|uniref:GAP family protein n=1 Tax=Mycobacterium sp. TaxID=1785 RepID=UPI003C7564A4